MKIKKKSGALSLTAAAALILALLITMSFAGCEMASLIPVKTPSDSGQIIDTQPDDTTTPPDVTTAEPPETPVIRIFHPLTGLETTEELSVSRPVAFSLSNTAYAFPQFGIGQSDIMLEFPIESGATRLVVITSDYGTIEKIGAIRSTRTYISDIVKCFDAIQVCAGTSDVTASVSFEDRDMLDYLTQNLQSLCYRDTSRVMPHNLMTTGYLVSSEIQKLAYRTTLATDFSLPFGFSEFGTSVQPGNVACSELLLTFSASQNAKFTYQAATGEYLRSQLGEKQIDGNDNSQLSFRNLLILFSDCATYETSSGSEFALTLNGGSGYYITDGTRNTVTWTYENGSLAILDADGNPLAVNRGTTYLGFMKVTEADAVQIIR